LRGGRGSVAAMSRRGVENRNTNIFQVTERKRKVDALDKDKCEDYSWKSKLKEGFLEVENWNKEVLAINKLLITNY
jgi:hypothetical protein